MDRYIEKHELIEFGSRVLLTVSGGVDSVVMAHLFAHTDYVCAIAHCNFQLRGEESEADESFVRELAASMDMPVFVERFDVGLEMEQEGISLQMAARDLRYRWFHELATEQGFQLIATAHNLNDSVETFFLNLSRGTGVRGLGGIPCRNGMIIRPLLFASRQDIVEYAEKKQIRYREDSSNRETRYARNKIRHDVIPHLETLNPAFLETMAGNMNRMEELVVLVENARERIKKEIFHEEGGSIRISLEKLRSLHPFATWIYELFSPFGFGRQQCEAIAGIMDASSGKRFLSPSHQLFKDRDALILVENKKDSFDRFYLDSPEKHSSLPFAMDIEVRERSELGKIPREAKVACLDYDAIQFPLTIRHWLPGDYFCPFGMDGQAKKLSDFFIDQKLPVPEKDRTWVLASGKKIVWVMGHRIDHRFRINDETQKVLLLRLVR